MDEEFCRRLLLVMSDDELQMIMYISREIFNARIDASILSGEYPEVEQHEREEAKEAFAEAILSYHTRTEVPVPIAERVMFHDNKVKKISSAIKHLDEQLNKVLGSQRRCIHTEHCCKNCGCKYGDEDCPVVLGTKEQTYPCGRAYTCQNWKDYE